jgi:hypothetical protein
MTPTSLFNPFNSTWNGGFKKDTKDRENNQNSVSNTPPKLEVSVNTGNGILGCQTHTQHRWNDVIQDSSLVVFAFPARVCLVRIDVSLKMTINQPFHQVKSNQPPFQHLLPWDLLSPRLSQRKGALLRVPKLLVGEDGKHLHSCSTIPNRRPTDSRDRLSLSLHPSS